MQKRETFYVAPFRRRSGELVAQDLMECPDEGTAFRRGRHLLAGSDGMVFFKIQCSEDGDVWSEVELLATVGDVPAEAA